VVNDINPRKGNTVNRIIAAVLLAALAVSGCASLPDSIKGPFARVAHTASDADVQQPEARPYPQATDQGKF
jgi:starvation-inducible outer membrane lipoprotein